MTNILVIPIQQNQCANTGKVWHIKHFCCAECSVPLGGHQYIIVDQTLDRSRARQQRRQPAASEPAAGHTAQQPFCLQCFDRIFGETCAQCKRLITCDSGAINHDLRSWHASADCFKCQHCSKSLLGRPFLPSQDGEIYCSIGCCETSSKPSENKQRPNMSLAHYLDPRAVIMTSSAAATVQQQAQAASSAETTAGQLAAAAATTADSHGLARHKPLIDYLITSAHSDETSRHLLQYIRARFERPLQVVPPNEATKQTKSDRAQELELLDQISRTLDKLSASSPSASELQMRRDKLNPFLVDKHNEDQQRREKAQHENEFVCMMMERVLTGPNVTNIANNLGYMNLDSISVTTGDQTIGGESSSMARSERQPNKPKGIDCVDRANPTADKGQNGRLVNEQRAGQRSKLSQCSPVASLISNEGTISDHSATSTLR